MVQVSSEWYRLQVNGTGFTRMVQASYTNGTGFK